MIESSWFFDGWTGIVRVLVLGTIGYAALVALLRISRKRTLAQMNVFDFVYIVVMGELLAMTIMNDEISLAKGFTALTLLVGLQALISWLTTRSGAVERAINGEPTLLFHRGRFLRDAMRAQRVTEEELLAAMREEGMADVDEVEAVVLETNGEFSVVHTGAPPHEPTLRDVPNAPEHESRRAKGRRAKRDAAHAETASH